MAEKRECVGVMGRLFGHKFVKFNWTSNGCCFRCGMKQD